MSEPTQPADDRRPWAWALGLVGLLTLVRLWAIFATPLELYPDEAQYWLWSRVLDFGYFSKPPMIAWLIAATTAIGGDTEPWVRLSAPLLNAATALLIFAVGRRLYGAWVGLAACAVYSLMPGVQLSSWAIATDAPLLTFSALALLAYVEMVHAASPRRGIAWAAALGAAMGLAFLSKYAAAYALAGLLLHAMISQAARRAWSPGRLAAVAGVTAAVVAPNLAWNAAHHFATFAHTAANANWHDGHWFNPLSLGRFLGAQFGVFGPIPFAVLALGLAAPRFRGPLREEDRLLLCFTLPALVAVSVQALLSRANANLAAAAYVPGSVLVAAGLLRRGEKGWLAAGLGLQVLLLALFATVAVWPSTADRLGLANGLKRARGWSPTVAAIVERAGREPSLSAVAVDDRFLFNEAAYYGRTFFSHPGTPPLKVWVRGAHPENQAELAAPLTAALGGRVLGVSLRPEHRAQMQGDFGKVGGIQILTVSLDAKHQRRADLFIGEGFAPRSRSGPDDPDEP